MLTEPMAPPHQVPNSVRLLIGLLTFAVLTTWRRGSEIIAAARSRAEGPLREFVAQIAQRGPSLARVPGTAVFLNRAADTAPLAMRANVEHNKVMHERAIVLSIDNPPMPRVPEGERMAVDDLGYTDGRILFVRAKFGYMEEPDVPALLQLIDPEIDRTDLSYFPSRVDVVPGPEPTMVHWRKRLFVATSHIAADAAAYFSLPPDQTAIIGARIAL